MRKTGEYSRGSDEFYTLTKKTDFKSTCCMIMQGYCMFPGTYSVTGNYIHFICYCRNIVEQGMSDIPFLYPLFSLTFFSSLPPLKMCPGNEKHRYCGVPDLIATDHLSVRYLEGGEAWPCDVPVDMHTYGRCPLLCYLSVTPMVYIPFILIKYQLSGQFICFRKRNYIYVVKYYNRFHTIATSIVL